MNCVSLFKILSKSTGLRLASLPLLRRRHWPRLMLIVWQMPTAGKEAVGAATEEDVVVVTTAAAAIVAVLAQLTSAELFMLVRES